MSRLIRPKSRLTKAHVQVTKIAGPDLEQHFKERVMHAGYTYKSYIEGLWKGLEKLPKGKVVDGIIKHPQLKDMYEACLRDVPLFEVHPSLRTHSCTRARMHTRWHACAHMHAQCRACGMRAHTRRWGWADLRW